MPIGGKRKNSAEIALLEQELAREPGSASFAKLADAYTRVGRYQEAVRVCRQGLQQNREHVAGYVALGRALFAMGHLPAATEALRQAVTLDRKSVEGHRLLGEVLMRREIYTEAVSLLEQAIGRGLDDSRLRALLERAHEALDGQATQVADSFDNPRGIGNVAVAGTIDDEEQDILDQLKATTRDLRADGDSFGEEADTALEDKPSWQEVDQQWSAQIDETTTTGKLETDRRDPFARRRSLEVALHPLSDPIAEGMPPIPGAAAGEVQPTGPPRGDATGPPVPGDGLLRGTPLSGLDETSEAVTRVRVDRDEPEPAPAEGREQGLKTLPKLEVPDGVFTTVPVERGAGAGDERQPSVRLRPAPGAADPVDLSDIFASQESSPVARISASTAELAGLELEQVPPRRAARIGSAVVWVLVLAALAAGAWLGWRHWQKKQQVSRARAVAARARVVASGKAMSRAIAALERASAAAPRDLDLIAELELARALAWLWAAEGAAPQPSSKTADHWAGAAARAAIALSDRDPKRAEELLRREPAGGPRRSVRLTLLAWGAWLDGRPRAAETAISEALQLEPACAAALQLRGHMAREIGDFAAARTAYRAVLERHPDPQHQLAGLALAATDHAAEDFSAAAQDWTALDPESPLAAAWRRLLRAERESARARRKGSESLVAAAKRCPPRRELLGHAARALIRACRFDEAADLLAQLGPQQDPNLRVLRAELAVARGVPSAKVVSDGPIDSQRHRRLRSWALLQRLRPSAAAWLVKHDTTTAGAAYRLTSAALAGDADAAEKLAVLARRGGRARLGLAWLKLRRGDADAAKKLARTLSGAPLLRAEAAMVIGESSWLAGDLAATKGALDLQGCRGYLPGLELRGQLLVGLGRFCAAEKQLERAYKAGRRRVPGLVALARAKIGCGKGAAAAPLLDAAERELGAQKPTRGEKAPPKWLAQLLRDHQAQVALARGELALAQGKPRLAARYVGTARRVRCMADRLDALLLGVRAALARGGPRSQKRGEALLLAAKKDQWERNPKLHLARGDWYRARGDEQATVEYAMVVKEIDRDRAYSPRLKARALLGWARLGRAGEKGKPSTWVRDKLREATRTDPTFADAFFALGGVCHARRETACARAAYTRFLAIETDGARARRARAVLRKTK